MTRIDLMNYFYQNDYRSYLVENYPHELLWIERAMNVTFSENNTLCFDGLMKEYFIEMPPLLAETYSEEQFWKWK